MNGVRLRHANEVALARWCAGKPGSPSNHVDALPERVAPNTQSRLTTSQGECNAILSPGGCGARKGNCRKAQSRQRCCPLGQDSHPRKEASRLHAGDEEKTTHQTAPGFLPALAINPATSHHHSLLLVRMMLHGEEFTLWERCWFFV